MAAVRCEARPLNDKEKEAIKNIKNILNGFSLEEANNILSIINQEVYSASVVDFNNH